MMTRRLGIESVRSLMDINPDFLTVSLLFSRKYQKDMFKAMEKLSDFPSGTSFIFKQDLKGKEPEEEYKSKCCLRALEVLKASNVWWIEKNFTTSWYQISNKR